MPLRYELALTLHYLRAMKEIQNFISLHSLFRSTFNLLLIYFTASFTPFGAFELHTNPNPSSAWASPPPTPVLTESERSSLRYHLQNLLNEEELIIRNHNADLSDIRKQERDFAALKVFERIPFERDVIGLTQSLKESISGNSSNRSLKWIQFKPLGIHTHLTHLPREVVTNETPFRLTSNQLTESIPFQVTLEGKDFDLKQWIKSWPSALMRVIELEKLEKINSSHSSLPQTWTIKAHAFRFRKIEFPHLVPGNPLKLLPHWAQKNPQIFSEMEPTLWNLVQEINTLAPKTLPHYPDRGRLLLNNHRMNFFLSKADPKMN